MNSQEKVHTLISVQPTGPLAAFATRYDFVAQVNDNYYANICECGANFGDHYRFHPDGGFGGIDEPELSRIEVVTSDSLKVNGDEATLRTDLGSINNIHSLHAVRSFQFRCPGCRIPN